MSAQIHYLPASRFAQQLTPVVMKQREERRRVRRTTREFQLTAVDLGRARNEMDCCAVCSEPLNAREFMAWCPSEMIVSHARCGRRV